MARLPEYATKKDLEKAKKEMMKLIFSNFKELKKEIKSVTPKKKIKKIDKKVSE